MEDDIYNNCYNEKPEENYYLDNLTNPSIYRKCFNNCKTCDKLGNETNNECINCIDKYYKMENDIYNNCYNEKPYENYYLDNLTNTSIYRKCFNNCKTCDNQQTNEDNCISCVENNYFIVNSTNCTSENEKPNNTFFNNLTEKFEYCFSNCTCKKKRK